TRRSADLSGALNDPRGPGARRPRNAAARRATPGAPPPHSCLDSAVSIQLSWLGSPAPHFLLAELALRSLRDFFSPSWETLGGRSRGASPRTLSVLGAPPRRGSRSPRRAPQGRSGQSAAGPLRARSALFCSLRSAY